MWNENNSSICTLTFPGLDLSKMWALDIKWGRISEKSYCNASWISPGVTRLAKNKEEEEICLESLKEKVQKFNFLVMKKIPWTATQYRYKWRTFRSDLLHLHVIVWVWNHCILTVWVFYKGAPSFYRTPKCLLFPTIWWLASQPSKTSRFPCRKQFPFSVTGTKECWVRLLHTACRLKILHVRE